MGLHTGEASEAAGDLLGAAVDAAARICAKAAGGEILVSEVVRQLCGSVADIVFDDRGHVTLTGFPERWHLYRVTAAQPPPVTLAVCGQTPFVGREAERAQLRGLVQAALAGHGALVMIGGEPGVGKSRLSQETSLEGHARGFRVFTGHCYESGGDLPYMPWVEMVEAAARETPADLFREALGDAAPELARMVPQLRRILPDIPPPLELPPDQQRRYMFSTLGDYVARLAAVEPRLYVLEDLHWADASTLLFLGYLAERLSTLPVLIIGTYRDAPIDISPLLAETLSGCVRSPQAHLLSLKRHSESEVEALLHSLSRHRPPPAFTAAFHAQTEGNAFFVEELFRHLAEAGRMLDDAGDFRADLRVDQLDVPQNVRLVTGQRLDRISETTRHLLTVGAVIGRRFEFGLVEAVAELDEDAILDTVEEGERAGLVFTESVGRATHIWFAHELVRQTFLARLSTLRRERYHLRVADALERLYADDLAVHASDIAHHLVQAREAADPVRTAGFLALAGDRALEAAAFEEALRYYEQGLALLPGPEARQRADLLHHLARAHRSLSHWDDATAAWEQSIALLDALGDVEAVASVCWEFGMQLVWGARLAEALALVERGLTAGGHGNRARMLALKAVALAAAGAVDEVGACVAEATQLALAQGDESLLGEVGYAEMYHHYICMRFALGIEPARRAADRLRRAGALWQLADVWPFLYGQLVYLGRFHEAEEVAAELDPLVERLGHSRAAFATRIGHFYRLAAQTAELGMLNELSLADWRMAQALGSTFWLASASTRRGVVAFWRGEWAEAKQHLSEGARLAIPSMWFGGQHGALCLLLANEGNSTEALAVLDHVTDSLPQPGRSNTTGQWTLALFGAEAVGVLKDSERSRGMFALVVEALATGTLLRAGDGALLQRAAGIAAAAAGLYEQAEQHFEEALRQARELPHLMERPTVRDFYARFLMERGGSGDAERAGTLLDEAAAGYRSIGMVRHLERVDTLRSRLGEMAQTTRLPRKPRYPDSLTAREMEILKLLASGLTSGELAAKLHLSVATIQRHIANIYSKIGVRNRAEATAYALRQQLADPGDT
jgi:DNA-binding CsgD family transcriptional regulator